MDNQNFHTIQIVHVDDFPKLSMLKQDKQHEQTLTRNGWQTGNVLELT